MVELSTDEIYIFDPLRFTISRTNATASVRTGYSAEALCDMTPASLKVGLSELDYRAKLMPLVDGSARSITFDAIQRRRGKRAVGLGVHGGVGSLQSVGKKVLQTSALRQPGRLDPGRATPVAWVTLGMVRPYSARVCIRLNSSIFRSDF